LPVINVLCLRVTIYNISWHFQWNIFTYSSITTKLLTVR